MEPEVKEEGLIFLGMPLQPRNGLINNNIACVTLKLSDGFSVADEVARIEMRRLSVVTRCKLIVESMIRRHRLVGELLGG